MTNRARTRRDFLTGWVRHLRESKRFEPLAPVPTILPEFVRPPGALDESLFLETCERCHSCADACPHDAIIPLGSAYGAVESTPAILPQGGACHLCEDLPCAVACPSGALSVIPIAEVRMGRAELLPGLCLAVKGKPCDDCVKACPVGETAIRWSDDRPEILDACTGCGMCVEDCPATPPAFRVAPWAGAVFPTLGRDSSLSEENRG